MAFKLTDAQHRQLDEFLGDVLDLYKSGVANKREVVGILAHVLTAAALDDQGGVTSWLEMPELLENWKASAGSHRA